MANAIISVVLNQLTSFVEKEVRLAVGVREEVEKLVKTLRIIQAVVADAEEKQVKVEAVKIWLEELKDLIYDADDVLDEWHTKTAIFQQRRVDDPPGTLKKVLSYLLSPLYCFTHGVVRYDIGGRIKVIRERLDGITEQMKQFGLIVGHSDNIPRQQTSSLFIVPEIRGRGRDKEEIMERLLSESSRQSKHVHVIAIVGMGGIGKTALAKLVVKEEKVVKAFEKRMWVSVLLPFDLIGLAKAIIKESDGDVPGDNRWEAISQCLCNCIKGKRFLLVLDDVRPDSRDLHLLKLSLDGGAQGSRIIVTTRAEQVAEVMKSTCIYRLGQLSDEDSWLLLRDVALKGREEDVHRFEYFGRGIANKGRGVPLAIMALASLLSQKMTKRDWSGVLSSGLWDVTQTRNSIFPSLLMNYYSLPSESKQCFLYCAIFPKDTVMKRDDLVKLWMAQGFLRSSWREPEEVGGECFDILAQGSFFQDFEIDSDGNITSCKMHDLVHDLGQYLTRSEYSLLEMNDMQLDGNKVRHLYAVDLMNLSVHKAKNIRTLISHGFQNTTPAILIDLFDQLTCLRTLDLSYTSLEELPNEVERLLHLRYLDLSNTPLLGLPETLSRLYNLQTLKLNYCRSICKLPDGIGNLSNLRHLEIIETDALSYLPLGIGRLSSLRTLSKFIVGGTTKECKIGDLKLLNNLQGVLEIKGLEQVVDMNEVAEAELKNKRNLLALTFQFGNVEGDDRRKTMEGVLEKLEPHKELEGLNISGYPGSQFPFWMESSLFPCLVNMKLYACKQCIHLPALGKLISLEILEISKMSSVRNIGSEFYASDVGSYGTHAKAFPRLKMLTISDMAEWEEWELPVSVDRQIMPELRDLSLKGCTKLRALPPLWKLKSLENLVIEKLTSIKRFCCGGSPDDGSFPKLKKLLISNLEKLEEWDLQISKDANIMSSLCQLRLSGCPMLQALPGLGKLKSLEILEIYDLSSLKVNVDFLGLSLDVGDENSVQQVVFPELRELTFWFMLEWEEWSICSLNDSVTMPCLRDIRFTRCPKLKILPDIKMPCLRSLTLSSCRQLNVIPQSMFSSTLRKLTIRNCSKLSGKQPCLPPILEKLTLKEDAGVFSKSLPIDECFIQSVSIKGSLHSSLPKGFTDLKGVQEVQFSDCENLDFELKEMKYLDMLQELNICTCPVLEQRFQRGDWRSILSHVPKITIDYEEITKND
ncbi:hypothetical protein ACHQM5_003988 [Ranunculus cassubicifolius]